MASRGLTSFSRCYPRSGKNVTSLFNRPTIAVHSHQWNAIRAMSNQSRLVRGGKLLFKATAVGLLVGTTYSVYRSYKPTDWHQFKAEKLEPFIIDRIPDVPIARKIVGKNDKSNLDLVLFQYQTCPFCCKVRAFLDFHGFSYSVVEVDSVLRQSLKWSPYKKVPSLLARRQDGTYIQMSESSMIISALSMFLVNPKTDIGDIVKLYPTVLYTEQDGQRKPEVDNKYFLLYGDKLPKNVSYELLDEERKWRSWIDNHFIHLISPNVYRTFSEALETFRWFSDAGEWDRLFPSWERNLMVGAGALAMYLIGKRLKHRHCLDDDVRQHMYDACNKWTKELRKKNTPFMGGSEPNLADLAFYGALTCMEGCRTFDDIRKHTKLDTWFEPMKKLVQANKGLVVHPVSNA